MDHEAAYNNLNKFSNVIIANDVIHEVSPDILNIIGYSEKEILGKSIQDINSILKIFPKFDGNTIDMERDYYLFTKTLDCINFKINITLIPSDGSKLIEFVENKKFNPYNISLYLNQIIKDNILGVGILSGNDLCILRANEKFLMVFGDEFIARENGIGRQIKEITSDEAYKIIVRMYEELIEAKKSIKLNEVKFMDLHGNVTFLDGELAPIYTCDKLDYIIATLVDVTEKVLTRNQLERQTKVIQEQNKRFKAILDNMSDGVFLAYHNGKISLLNSAAKRLVYEPESVDSLGDIFENTSFTDMKGNIIPAESLPIQRALKGEEVKKLIGVINLPDKELITEWSSSPIWDKDGNLTMALLCTHDITDLVKSKRIIEDKNKELEAIIENISEELYIFDNEKIKLNEAAKKRMHNVRLKSIYDLFENYSYFDLIGNKISLEDFPVTKVEKGMEVKNYTLVAFDPEKRYICINGKPVFDELGDFKMGVISIRDVTSDVAYKYSIERQVELLFQIIYNLDLPLFRLSYPEFNIVDLNQKAFETSKNIKPEIKSASAIKGRNIEFLIPQFYNDVEYRNVIQSIEDNKTQLIIKRKNIFHVEETYFNIIFEPILGISGKVEEVIIVIIDVTQEVIANKKMEKTLKQQEEFFANISHELKTPLNVVYSTVQLFNLYLERGTLDNNKDSIRRHIKTITSNCYRLSKLINNLVDISKIESGFYELNLSNNDIVELVEDIVMQVSDYTYSKGLNIIFDTDIEEKVITCDPEKIERVMLNLISNAIKFSDTGDDIYVSIKNLEEFVEISVQDNGIGIDRNYIHTIFERFKQIDKSLSRNAEGTGIGLSLVKSIVELHGGKIFVESEIGIGSTFKIYLPNEIRQEADNANNYKAIRNNTNSINIEFSDIYTSD